MIVQHFGPFVSRHIDMLHFYQIWYYLIIWEQNARNVDVGTVQKELADNIYINILWSAKMNGRSKAHRWGLCYLWSAFQSFILPYMYIKTSRWIFMSKQFFQRKSHSPWPQDKFSAYPWPWAMMTFKLKATWRKKKQQMSYLHRSRKNW